MTWLWAALSAAGILDSSICSRAVAELAGYRLRQLFHGGKLVFRRRQRMRLLLRTARSTSVKRGMGSIRSRIAQRKLSPITRTGSHHQGLAISLIRHRLGTPPNSLANGDCRESEAFQ